MREASRFQFHKDPIWAKLSKAIVLKERFSFYFVSLLSVFESLCEDSTVGFIYFINIIISF